MMNKSQEKDGSWTELLFRYHTINRFIKYNVIQYLIMMLSFLRSQPDYFHSTNIFVLSS